MKTTTITKLIAFVTAYNETLKLWKADTRTFKHRIVDLDDETFPDEIKARETTYYVSFEDKEEPCDNFKAEFPYFEKAYEVFKEIVKAKGYKVVNICEDFESYNPYKAPYEEVRTDEEEYYDACLASEYGDNTLMERYNRKHGIEEEYGPSNPWDAPGMCVRDFIPESYLTF